MVDTVTGLREVARRMRALGHTVEFIPGWETRGVGAMSPRGVVNHHTAGSIAGGPAASLRVVTFGRPDLRNALCNTYSDRRARLYIVAARTAWHAGAGGWQGLTGNSQVLGHEAENNGVGEPWSPQHLKLMEDLDRVQIAVFGHPVSRVCEHKEWAPTRKIDRAGISGPAWRTRIQNAAAPPAVKPAKPTVPTPPPTPERTGIMYVCRKDDRDTTAVRMLQVTLNDLGHQVTVDGHYGDKTATAVGAALGAKGPVDVVNPSRCRRLENAVTLQIVNRRLREHNQRTPHGAPGPHEHEVTITGRLVT